MFPGKLIVIARFGNLARGAHVVSEFRCSPNNLSAWVDVVKTGCLMWDGERYGDFIDAITAINLTASKFSRECSIQGIKTTTIRRPAFKGATDDLPRGWYRPVPHNCTAAEEVAGWTAVEREALAERIAAYRDDLRVAIHPDETGDWAVTFAALDTLEADIAAGCDPLRLPDAVRHLELYDANPTEAAILTKIRQAFPVIRKTEVSEDTDDADGTPRH